MTRKKSDEEQQPEQTQNATPEISERFAEQPPNAGTENQEWWRGDGGSGEVQ